MSGAIWTEEEDELLLHGKQNLLSYHAICVKYLPGKEAGQAKYRFRTLTAGRQATYSSSDPGIEGGTRRERLACTLAELELLTAIGRYYRKHHPGSEADIMTTQNLMSRAA